MTFSEIVAALDDLSRVEKLQIIQHLAAKLAEDERLTNEIVSMKHEIWSPVEAYDAAAILQQFLEEERLKKP